MRATSDSILRRTIAALVFAAAISLGGCSWDPPPPPELTPQIAIAQIFDRWAREELSHFKVTFHSDTLIGCGVEKAIWKLVEVTDANGQAWSTNYRLTTRGQQILSAIDLNESGRGHGITLKGPYRIEINSIAGGGGPNLKRVGFHWSIDWDQAAPEIRACFPRFELTGSEVAQFELVDPRTWRFASYADPNSALPAQGAAGSVLDKAH
jgi:hypothetical protein